MIVKKVIVAFLGMCLLFGVVAKSSNIKSPVIMLSQVSSAAIKALKQQKAHYKKSEAIPTQVIHNIIEQQLLSHIDLDMMSRSVVGRQHWAKASKSEQQRFEKQFTNLVVNTYASALRSFDNNKIAFYPIRGGYVGKDIVQVNSTITSPGRQPLPVTYHLNYFSGQWLVYDFSVDGISLVESYRSQFASILQQKGLSGLITMLKQHNASGNK